MSNQKKNIFHTLNFNSFFPQLSAEVKGAVEKFWEIDTPVALQAINNFKDVRDECLISDLDFFSSQIRVEHHKPVLIRFSKDFIENFLETTLKNKDDNFLLSSLTPLEVKILNSFSEFLYKRIKETLISPKEAKLSEASEKRINFLFILNPTQDTPGHLVISIPIDRLPLEPISKTTAFKDEDFLTSSATVKIRIGRTKITLEDLENLSSEDIILLEESNLSYLTLISGKLEQNFKVKINTSLIVNLDDEDDLEEIPTNNEFYNDEVTMEKNLWDDIQIELSAEFEKVKMTIGELKQITQGQVVDLGSVFDNEISLYVENKKVAKGELIIINDRYAVKLSEVLSSSVKQNTEPKPAPGAAKAQPAKPQAQNPAPAPTPKQQAPKPTPAPQQAPVEDEEFDYSDFEK